VTKVFVYQERTNSVFICLPGSAAIPLLWRFLNKWPNPDTARTGDPVAMSRLLQPLGLHEKRANTIIRFSS